DRFEFPSIVDVEPDILTQRLNRVVEAKLEPDELVVAADSSVIRGGAVFPAQRAGFPAIKSLDAFSGFFKSNPFQIELEFYLFAAIPLWKATLAVIKNHFHASAEDALFFCHDWMGLLPILAGKVQKEAKFPIKSIYIAHETRLIRLLVEG